MTCLDAAGIARAATAGVPDPHLGECLDCRRRFESDRAAREALRILPVPRMSPSHREALAAQILAYAQHERPRRRHRATAGVVAAAALAAAAAAIASWPRQVAPEIAVVAPVSEETPAMRSRTVARVEPPPVLAPPRIDASGGAVLAHDVGIDRDVLTLSDGVIEVDTRTARQVDVRVGETVIRVDHAAVEIVARGRAIVSVRVVVGAARITGAGQRVTLQRDSLWLPGPSAKQRALEAFHDAWVALRAGRNREAMELFDRVTDPVAVEEASYWAAIAARRAGELALANERLERFLERFPRSEYAEQIRREQP